MSHGSNYNLQPEYENTEALETRDRAISVLYGRTTSGPLKPISIDSTGKLLIGTPLLLTTDNIDIGDIVIKGVIDAAQTVEERIALRPSTGLAAGLFSILTEDPRLTFTGSLLNVNVSATALGITEHHNGVATSTPATVSFSGASQSILINNIDLATTMLVSFDGDANIFSIVKGQSLSVDAVHASVRVSTSMGTANYQMLVVV